MSYLTPKLIVMSGYPGIEPLEITAGGQIAPDQAIGRGEQIEALLRLAKPGANGALLLGDRRIGKTTLFTAIEGPLRDAGHRVIRVSAETSQLDTFGRELSTVLRRNGRAWGLEISAEASVNVGVGKITVSGKGSRQSAEEDLFTLCTRDIDDSSPFLVVFLIDEITVLATSLARRDPEQGLEFLRTLRRARQSSDRVLMYYAGSIGLHHAALDDTEVNDLQRFHVDVLDPGDAAWLATRLMAGIDLRVTSVDAVASEIATVTDGFPFYIQSLVQYLGAHRRALEPVSPQTVHAAFIEALGGWDVEHYDARIDEYYGSDDSELVRAVLDHVATSGSPVSVDELLVLPTVAAFAADRTRLLHLLHRLELDHYLRRVGSHTTMANGAIRRFWFYLRRLS